MQHEMMRQPAPVNGSENVGDVLASIRRLIAQDETPSPIPNQMLNTLPRGAAAAMDEATADTAPEAVPDIGPWATDMRMQDAVPDIPMAAEPLPLILNTSDLIAPDFPGEAAEMLPEPDLAATPDPEPSETPPIITGDIAPEAVAETTVEMTPDPLPETISPKPPEVALWSQPTPRLEFNLGALWADLPETESPTSDPASTDSAGLPEPPMDDTAPYSLNLMQPEENMLHANASVTPINPNIDAQVHAHAEFDALRDGGEPHLFAPQDKGAQKGTHLRGMIREAIRQELQGEIGNRLSRNLQQMIRHEIELTLRQMCEQE